MSYRNPSLVVHHKKRRRGERQSRPRRSGPGDLWFIGNDTPVSIDQKRPDYDGLPVGYAPFVGG